MTEAITEAIKEEIAAEYHMPTLILGDFNAETDSLSAVKDLTKDEQWFYVGVIASWWGGQDAEPTCQTRPQGKAT